MGVGIDEMLDALGAIQRRRVLVELLESPDGSLHGITDPGTETAFAGDAVAMKHVHLPKLDDYGFVEWHEDAHVVRTGEQFDEIEPLLVLLSENQERFSNDWV